MVEGYNRGVMKPKNKVAINPLLKKSHAHKSAKDYDRAKTKQDVNSGSEVDHIVLKGTIWTEKQTRLFLYYLRTPLT